MTMPAEPGGSGGGGLMGSKIMGIPTIVWVGGIALIVYFLFFKNANSGSTPTTSGNPGTNTQTTGATTLDSGAVTVTVNQTGADDTGDQPSPPVVGGGTGSGGGGSTTSPNEVTLPNEIGKRGEAGQNALKALGLKTKQTPARTPKGKTTTITSQKPGSGTKVPKGSTVDVGLKVNK